MRMMESFGQPKFKIFLPIYYKLGITSIYEYLDIRFGKYARLSMTIVFLTQSILYNGLVVFAPALAMNQVAGLNLDMAILLVGFVCIFYTGSVEFLNFQLKKTRAAQLLFNHRKALGGMKAVVWTDVYQTIWMLR